MKLRESPVVFDQEKHTYRLEDILLEGVTTLLRNQLFQNKYDDIPKEILEKAAKRGTLIHEQCELVDALGIDPVILEAKNYKLLKEEHGLKPIANEYLISDELAFASSVDVIFDGESENDDEVYLADIKTTAKLDIDWLSWQLSIYAYMFEMQNPHLRVKKLYAIWLRNEVKELKYVVDLQAVGAMKQLGAGLRILGINKSNVETVDFGAGAAQRDGSLSASRIFEDASYETTGSELVIPLFGDAHSVYGYTGTQRPMLNTGNASTSLTDIYTLEVIIKLKNAVSIPSVTNCLDFFIAYQGTGEKRTEIHLNQFNSATANGQLADNNVLEVIKVVNNTWALCVPDKFAYPTERTVITEAYAKFADWAHDQSTNTDWYNMPSSSDKVIEY